MTAMKDRPIRWGVELTDEEHARRVAEMDAREIRASGKNGLKLIGRTSKPDLQWSAVIEALCEIGSIARADQSEACRSEWLKGFSCPGCGSSSGFARRDVVPDRYDGIRVSCGRHCLTRDIRQILGLTVDDLTFEGPGVLRTSAYVSGTEDTPAESVPGTYLRDEVQERPLYLTPSTGTGDGTDSGTPDEAALFFDMATMLAGGVPDPPAPAFAFRTDGNGLFYAGQVNFVFGDPESGKTWLCLATGAETLRGAKKVAVIDMDHNGPEATADRLHLLGVPLDVLSDPRQFRYVEPEDKAHLLAVVAALAEWGADIVIVDSIGELLPLLGLSSNSPDDYTIASNYALKPMARSGAAVLAIDHLAKGAESRSQGATGTGAKRRAVGGVSLRVTLRETFVPGRGGRSALTIHKDRPGGLRRYCPTPEKGEALAGYFILEAGLTGETTWHITAPKPGERAPVAAAADAAELDALDPPPASVRDVARRMGWGKDRASDALREWREVVKPGCEECDRLALINPEMECWQHR